MNEEERPGGLTALAVINFIFSGLYLFGLLGWIVIFLVIIGIIPTDQLNEIQRTQMEAFQKLGIPVFIFVFTLSLVSSVLLLLSGIGYLKQKKFMGRALGNIYAIIDIISSVISGIILTTETGGGFTIMTMVGLIYPILTLILLNTTFKEDLTN